MHCNEMTRLQASAVQLEPYVLDLLACPRDKEALPFEGNAFVCPRGHRYPVIEGVPIFLLSEAEQTHIEGVRALLVAQSGDASGLARFDIIPGKIDPFVQNAIGATNGGLYQHLVGNLTAYPIPQLRLPPGDGKLFLEVGCNWGRWCIAAARAGYRPVGIDPSLKSIRAANRVATQLGIQSSFLVADSRYLPFREGAFDQVFSYSVLQHLSKEHARDSLREMKDVLRKGGGVLVQMANTYGLRCLYHQVRRGFRATKEFEVRYWRPGELNEAFISAIGPTQLTADGYFSLNVQPSDLAFMPARYRALVRTSEFLRRISDHVPLLKRLADSVYLSAKRMD
jgi:SAM-dependent methyltransferase